MPRLTSNSGPSSWPSYLKRFADLGWDQKTQGRYGMIENIDDNFGLLMQKLDEWKLWDDTLVIFMTDNGQAGRGAKLNGKPNPIFAAGFKTGKGSPFEGGTHVPAFWRWKGKLGEGVDILALTAHIDMFQTFCQLAGAPIPDDIQKIDGRTLLPLLENPKAEWLDRKLFFHVGRWQKGDDPNESMHSKCALRSQRWRFVNNKELYDIAADPYEDKDIASDHPDVVAEMRKAYDAWWAKTVPLMVNENAPYATHQPQAIRYEKQLKQRGIPKWSPPKR